MLRRMRAAGQGIIGKTLASILFVILIASFAVWGIGDIFRGGPQNTVARVGDTEITIEQFRTAYQNEIQRLSRQFGRNLTSEQARAFGLDQQVLSRMVTEAVFDQRTKALGLSASDQHIARSIVEEPAFQGAGGFDRNLFDRVLRDNNLSEAGYVQEQRKTVTRLHLAEAISGALPVPLAAREAVHRFGAERRGASYFVLPAAAAGEIQAPTTEQLQSFYNERKASFGAPEYRSLNVIALDTAALAKPDDVTEADARARYDQVKGARFGSAERRTVQQMVFGSPEEAQAAAQKIKEGTAFEAIATERNIAPGDLELGTFARAEMLDPAVADAAFALQEGAVSEVVQGRFGPVLVRVTKVQPEAVRPFEEVAGQIRQEIAQERARQSIDRVHDEIEDMRASARPLQEIAREKGLALVQVPAVDRAGRDKSGSPVADLPERDTLLAAAFASDVGVDNEALRTRAGGYVWYDVTGIEPPRERPLDEVRAEVEKQWREDEIGRRLTEKARGLVERLDKGDAIEAVAAEAGAEAKTAADLARRQAAGDLPPDAVNRIFATPVGKAGSVAGGPESRVVFKVTAASVPPYVTTTQEAERVEDQLRSTMSDDLLAEFVAEAQKGIAVTVNQQALRQVVGGEI
ncbi:MAG TPA: SurA N-terminal domain-containing protein [Microvirga sp.]|jgi:peptidyl-prolyl cis-trans isomerase D|nr:SurA N-terminal domain-containing protein [Microvirga sp.]